MTRRPRYIEHLTLDTGHQRRCWREEVSDDVIAMLRPLLDQAVREAEVDFPSLIKPNCTMAGRVIAGGLILSVFGPPRGPLASPLATVAVAPDSLAAAELWPVLTGRDRDDRTPSPPWCAVRLMPGLALHPRAAHWLGDFERCVAWAWVAGE